MLAPDYRCDVKVRCVTCDVVGQLNNCGTLAVSTLLRNHRNHDVEFDFLNVRHKKERKS